MVGSIPRSATSAEVADLLSSVERRIRRAARHDLEPAGITWGQARALRALAGAGQPIRMSALAARLRIARRSATSVVDDLEALGLVARASDAHDGRAVTVEVTAAGRALLDRLAERRRAAATVALSSLDPSELRTLRDVLRRLDSAASRDPDLGTPSSG